MSESEELTEKTVGKRSKLPLVLGICAALLLGGAGFYTVYSGLIPAFVSSSSKPGGEAAPSFVPLDPLIISLGPQSRSTHLRFAAQLEVDGAHQKEIVALMPRIQDAMNGYLHALEMRELEEPGALIRLRAQMLRRIQIVTGEGRVKDLLVTEFVLN
ncbi:flagellar basal body-associated protein FliL [Plastorhodobacter daqingensis]|uniref:Flagellar protein FliL n=1 Tax=Plastorhodobacter daqingensis TaxID=1387281 RepID=A0ABW2UDA4_9RHOB